MKIIKQIDVTYDPNHDLKADIYLPDEEFKSMVIDIHGGGWFRGDKQKDADWAQRIAEHGYAVIVPNYRITPDGYYPAPLQDMDNLIQWIKEQDFAVDKFAAVGGSAGGNMAVELAIKYGMPAISLSGIIDIEDWLSQHQNVVAKEGDTSHFNQQASAQINQNGADDGFYKWFVVNYFNGKTDQYHEASPVFRVSDQTGPMYLANSLDEFVPTSGVLQMAQALTDHNVPFTVRMITGQQHAKGYLEEVFDDTINFLDRYLA